MPIASLVGGKILPLIELSAAQAELARHALLRHPPAPARPVQGDARPSAGEARHSLR
jgi:ATP-dependent Lhr-like helicase